MKTTLGTRHKQGESWISTLGTSEQERFEKLRQSCLDNGELMYPGMLLARAADLYEDITALLYQDKAISYKELYARALHFTQYVVNEVGLKPRDRALICFDNSPEFYVAYYGLWQAGVVVIPTNTFLKEKELAYIITDSNPALIVTSSDRVELFQKTEVPLPPIATEKEMSVNPVFTNNPANVEQKLGNDELVALLYTSGTTGFPKGAMLSSKNIMTNVMQIAARLDMPHSERLFGVLPLFHSFAQNTCVWASVFYGVTVILVPKIERRFILEALEHKPTIFIGVPALYGFMCLLKNVSFNSVRLFVSGGDALPDKIRAAFGLLYRRRICNGYGLTETSPVISVFTEDETAPTNNVGRPMHGILAETRDENGVALPCEVIGILWVKGDNVMLGYYNHPEATGGVLQDGWLNTGDLAYIDRKGRIVITGREKDLIINKGVNIYPQEIENVLLLHANVIRAAVVGKKEDSEGEIPIAFIQLRAAQEGMEQALHKLCVNHLATYKIPRRFVVDTKDLPVTATGKVDKKVLRKDLNEKA